MAHPHNNPVVFELDDIASELEKTGNADLATLVDEVSAEIMTAPARKPVAAAAKPVAKPAAKPAKKGSKPEGKKLAETNVGSKRARIASAMRKIARAQVSELEDIASELLKEGDKKAALEVLKIAEDLDSEYEYSGHGKHKAPESKGDASERFNKNKANKPDAKMSADEKAKTETPFGDEDPGYPLTHASAKKKAVSKDAAFDKQLEALIRLAGEPDAEPDMDMDLSEGEPSEGDPAMDAADEDSDEIMDEMSEDSDEDDGDEDADDADLEGLEGLEGGDEEPASEEMSDGDDELAAMMEAMESSDGEDAKASSDRMYEADESEEDSDMPAELMDEAAEDADEAAEDADEDAELADESEEDDDTDEEAGLLGGLAGGIAGGLAGGPMGALGGAAAGSSLQNTISGSADKQKVLALAKKLAARGENKLAARVAKLAKK